MKNTIKSLALIFMTLIIGQNIKAQMKVGDNPITINGGSILELESANKGLLFPRIMLTNTTTWGLAGDVPVNGMVIYNTKTIAAGLTGTFAYPTIPGDGTGLYYWDGLGWVGTKGGAGITVDLRLIGSNNHITQDAGVGNGGTSLGIRAVNNIAIGEGALATVGIDDGLSASNIAMGYKALNLLESGRDFIAIGDNVFGETTSGASNIGIGNGVGNKLGSNVSNTLIGVNSLSTALNGQYTTTLGYGTLKNHTGSLNNTAIGFEAMGETTLGDFNTAVGEKAMTGLERGNYNTALGASTTFTTISPKYSTAIGAGATVSADNVLVLGGIKGSNAQTSVGLGTAAPTNKLHVVPEDTKDPVKIEGLNVGATNNDIVVSDGGVLKTIPSTSLLTEPWNLRGTTNKATLNTENIYQQGNVAIGTQNGISTSTFHVDAAKNNAVTGTPTATQVLDDFVLTPGGRVGIGYSPSDVVLFGRQFDDKITVQANEDLDVNYSLATTSNAQAIVHRNIISNGTIAARTARPNGTSIVAFEGHTSTSSSNFALGSVTTQQRAGIVLRTGKYTSNGGEIWFGTSGATPNGTAATSAGNAYRAIMDEKGNWSFGADPNGDAFYRNPTQRLDLILGGIRIGALGYGSLSAWQTLEIAERPNYISTNSADRLVVADANGVLKVKESSAINTEPWNVAKTAPANPDVQATSNTQNIYQMGKVGIGTSTPQGALHIATSNSDDVLFTRFLSSPIDDDVDLDFIRGYGNNTAPTPVTDNGVRLGGVRFRTFVNPTTLTTNPLTAFAPSAEVAAETDGVPSATSAPGKLIFQTTPVGGVSTLTRMTIKNDGNVGIGTTTPTAKLEVSGKIKATDVNFSGLLTYADEAAATTGGLTTGDMYKTATGELRIKL